MTVISEHGSLRAYVKGCHCDDCRAANAAYQREYYHRNKEKCLKRLVVTNARYEKSEKGQAARKLERESKQYREARRQYRKTEAAKQKQRERQAKYRKTDKNKVVQARYAKTENGKATSKRRAHARRARKLDQFVEHVDPRVVYQMHGGMCGICKEFVSEDDFHIDHITPLSRGGMHGYINVQPAHPACNRKKHNKE